MQLKQSLPAQSNSNIAKYPPSKSPQPASKPTATSIPKVSSSNVKSSPHASTSRSSAPSGVTSATQMDTDSDDDKPLAFRSSEARASMLKVQQKNGLVSSKADANGVKLGVANAFQNRYIQESEDSEDDKPLAMRMPQRPTTIPSGLTDSDDDKPIIIARRPTSFPAGLSDFGGDKPMRKSQPPTTVAAGLSDSDDDKPLLLRRTSNGAGFTKASVKGGISNQKKRPNDEITRDESSAKKLKLSTPPSKSSNVARVSKIPPSAPSNPIPKTEKSAPLRTSSSGIISKPSTMGSKSSSIPSTTPPSKASSAVPPKATVGSNKPSTVTAKPTVVSRKPSAVSAKPSTPRPGATSNAPVKMDLDEDEDDIPLAQRMPLAVKNVKKPVVKQSTGSLTSSMAAKKVVEARRAKLKLQQKKLMKKKREHDTKSDKNAPGADGGQKWTRLEHNGVIFPPPYLPHGIKMLYEGKPVTLTPEQEEVATMFAVMRETDYVQKQTFLSNFWEDWKKILGPRHIIQSLERCDFTPIFEWHLAEKEKKKLLSTEEKKRIKEEKMKQEEKYMWALVDGVKEKVGNFRVEPPGLFRGRGEHPKMGKLKRRIFPEDIVINISKDAPIPECPIPGHRWKEIRHDNTVTWLAYWIDPINQKEFKYVFLSASSNLKGQSDKEKYEKARTLKDYIEDIRKTYTKNFASSDMTKKQIAVATYLIDRLALRAGNEKDDDEADTVGCCSLKVEHVTLVPPKSLQFDFLGKDSIRYFNVVEVEEAVYKAVGEFKKSKANGDDLFDKLDTNKLNAHLKNIMPQLTAKVFRTYNASITLDRLLVETEGQTVAEKIASYQWANKEVAILCNHQRSVSKSHGAQMEKLEAKMTELEELLQELRTDLARAKKGKPPLKGADGKPKRNQSPDAIEKKIVQTEQKIEKMKLDMRIKDDLKTVALGTSKINYMDPRITVAWCKRHEVPIEKIFNKSLLAKFAWAMDVSMDYRF